MSNGPYVPLVLTLNQARALELAIDKLLALSTESLRHVLEGDTNIRALRDVKRKIHTETSAHDRRTQ